MKGAASKRHAGKRQPNASDRIHPQTDPALLRRIDRDLADSIRIYSRQPTRRIAARIRELEEEWDIERVLETNAATLALAGIGLGMTVNKKAMLLSFGVLGFLLQHAITGWCPPVAILRRMGFRTRKEIDRELYALKALRGDFRELPETAQEDVGASKIMDAINA